jgi:hypothetical protein
MLGEYEEAFMLQQYEDLRLIVLAALAYNMGFRANEPRTPDSVRHLDEACIRVGLMCGFNITPMLP